jgi:hypothetical protein
MSEGSVLFAGPGGLVSQDNANFFWDNTSNRLGVGTATPNSVLEVIGQNPNNFVRILGNDSTDGYNIFRVYTKDNSGDNFGSAELLASPEEGVYININQLGLSSDFNQTASTLYYDFNASGTPTLFLRSGQVGIGTNNPNARLTVLGQDGVNIVELLGNDSTTSYNTFRVYTKDNSGDNFGSAELLASPEDGIVMVRQSGDLLFSATASLNIDRFAAQINVNSQPTTNFVVQNQASYLQNSSFTIYDAAGNTPTSGGGTRLMWVPSRQAFRAGNVTGSQWDDNNLGQGSVAFGNDNISAMPYTFAIGESNIVGSSVFDAGYRSAAFGSNNIVYGDSAYAFGDNNSIGWDGTSVTSGSQSVAFGVSNTVGGGYSLVAGSNNVTTDAYSFCFGSTNSILGQTCFAFGSSNNVTGNTNAAFGAVNTTYGYANFVSGEANIAGLGGNYNSLFGFENQADGSIGFAAGQGNLVGGNSVALGNGSAVTGETCASIGSSNVVSGNRSVAIGVGNSLTTPVEDAYIIGNSCVTDGYNSVAIGSYLRSKAFTGVVLGNANDNSDNPAVNNPNTTDRIFQLGNGGYQAATRANAMTVLRNGNVGIGSNVLVPTSNLHLGGSLSLPYRAVTGVTTLTASDYTVAATSGTFNIALPTAIGIPGRVYTIKNSGTGAITVTTGGGQIDGASTVVLATQYSVLRVQSTGSAWIVI